jgi:hypothetical protein
MQKIEEDVLGWMGNVVRINIFSNIANFQFLNLFFQNYTVEVFFYPLSTVHPTCDTVLIPSAKLARPLLSSDLGYLNEQLILFSKVSGFNVSCLLLF